MGAGHRDAENMAERCGVDEGPIEETRTMTEIAETDPFQLAGELLGTQARAMTAEIEVNRLEEALQAVLEKNMKLVADRRELVDRLKEFTVGHNHHDGVCVHNPAEVVANCQVAEMSRFTLQSVGEEIE